MNRLPDYRIVTSTTEAVWIRDLDRGGLSITNGAEEVVADLHEKGALQGRRLFYIDSAGDLDELKHDGEGGFTGFSFGGPRPGDPIREGTP